MSKKLCTFLESKNTKKLDKTLWTFCTSDHVDKVGEKETKLGQILRSRQLQLVQYFVNRWLQNKKNEGLTKTREFP